MKVSVCIPVYGVERYIEGCARSLFEQTMQDGIEFIFVDDGTKDKSMEILLSVLEDYPSRKEQVRIIRHETNRGLCGARNTALRAAHGDYIIHCDSDDQVEPELYETMYRTAVENNSDVVCCAMTLEMGERKTRRLCLSGKTVDDIFVKYFNTTAFNSLCNKLFVRRIALDPSIRVPDHITMAEDLLRTSQMLLKCRRDVALCNNVSYHYFCDNPAASTANFTRKAFDSSFEAMGILLTVLSPKYSMLADACRGQILFSALRVAGVSKQEFLALYSPKIRRRVVFNRHLPLGKRGILALAFFSFALSRRLIGWGQWMHRR